MINRFIQIMQDWGLRGLFIGSILENLIPPIPSEVIMPRGGYLASIGKINLFTAIMVGSIGSTIGSIPYYFLGKVISKEKINKFVAKYGKYIFVSTKDVDNTYMIYQKNGGMLTFFGRFLPLGRGFVGLPAGSTNMPFWKFCSYTFAGTIIRVTMLTYIGYILGNDIAKTGSTIKIIEYIVIGIVIIGGISRGLHFLSKKYFKTK